MFRLSTGLCIDRNGHDFATGGFDAPDESFREVPTRGGVELIPGRPAQCFADFLE